MRNNSRSKKGRKQPLSSQGAASGPEVGRLGPQGNEFASGGVWDDSGQVQVDLRCQQFSSSGSSRLLIVLCLRPEDKEAFSLYTSLPSWEKAPCPVNFRGAWSRPICRAWRHLISALWLFMLSASREAWQGRLLTPVRAPSWASVLGCIESCLVVRKERKLSAEELMLLNCGVGQDS